MFEEEVSISAKDIKNHTEKLRELDAAIAEADKTEDISGLIDFIKQNRIPDSALRSKQVEDFLQKHIEKMFSGNHPIDFSAFEKSIATFKPSPDLLRTPELSRSAETAIRSLAREMNGQPPTGLIYIHRINYLTSIWNLINLFDIPKSTIGELEENKWITADEAATLRSSIPPVDGIDLNKHLSKTTKK